MAFKETRRTHTGKKAPGERFCIFFFLARLRVKKTPNKQQTAITATTTITTTAE